MINRAWSILSKGSEYSDPTASRKVSKNAYRGVPVNAIPMLDVLCPFSDDILRAHRVEGLVDLMLRSPFADKVREMDPINTYDKATISMPASAVHVEITAQPTDLRLFLFSDDDAFLAEGSAYASIDCVVNGPDGTVTTNRGVSSFTTTDGLSSYVEIYPGIRVRMQSDFSSGTPYEFTVTKTVSPTTDWADLLEKVSAVNAVWSDPDLEDTWRNDPVWSNRLAAFTVSAVELCINASTN